MFLIDIDPTLESQIGNIKTSGCNNVVDGSMVGALNFGGVP